MLNSILIVDDDETDRYMLKRLIKKGELAAQVHEATNGAEGLEIIRKRAEAKAAQPDLVFLDINMPLVDGFAFLERFAELGGRHDLTSVVVVMFSSSAREDDKNRALAYPFVAGFVTKRPMTSQDLRDELASITHLPSIAGPDRAGIDR